MLRNKRESIEWLEFEIFQDFPQIAHAIFLRHGGVSPAPYHELNLGGAGDDQHHIHVNRSRIKKIMECASFVGGHQVHGADVREVPFEIADDEKCDGLFTSKENVGLMIRHADCQAAIIYDPIENIIANVHAGWRGNVQNIYQAAALRLKSRFGSKPENLIVGITPSLGPCCAQFINFETELPRSFWEYQIKPLYFDLWEISRRQWLDAGVLPHHLQIACICTFCNKSDYFSYRRDKPTGRHATIIQKKQTIR
jgi:polyphenol oxidase